MKLITHANRDHSGGGRPVARTAARHPADHRAQRARRRGNAGGTADLLRHAEELAGHRRVAPARPQRSRPTADGKRKAIERPRMSVDCRRAAVTSRAPIGILTTDDQPGGHQLGRGARVDDRHRRRGRGRPAARPRWSPTSSRAACSHSSASTLVTGAPTMLAPALPQVLHPRAAGRSLGAYRADAAAGRAGGAAARHGDRRARRSPSRT